MDMAAKYQDQTVFHMTGKRSGDGLAALGPDLRPALLAAYGDLTRLRYDDPVVLLAHDDGATYVQTLTEVMGALIAGVAPRGVEGERVRRQLLRLERELRTLVAEGVSGTLTQLWPQAATRAAGGDAAMRDLLLRSVNALAVDGELCDCGGDLTARLAMRAWRNVYAERAARFRAQVDRLVRRLEDILRAAFVHSQAGQQPAALQAAFGTMHGDTFDFGAMSRLVSRNVPQDELPMARRARIESALAVLRAQPFYADPHGARAADTYEYALGDCASVLAAHRTRLPRMVEFVRALAIADLEARGAYVEADHDAFFERFDEGALGEDDLALFPDYLVCIDAGRNDAPENAPLMEILSAGLPVKVVVQHTDLLEDAAIGQGHFAFGIRSVRLAATAMGLGGLFVLQTTSANLYALRDRVRAGMASRGPALFSVFKGSQREASILPPYLTAAAAMKSRAFPAFSYDARAGSNWATRFSLENNRNADADWPQETLEFADEELQRVREPARFTYADFVLTDRRHAHHFAVVPRERWSAAMMPAADWLTLPESQAAERVPYVLAIDGTNRLHRVLVDTRLMLATRRCQSLWHRLQEHGGIHNSHAEQAVAREKSAWEAQKQQELAALRDTAPTAAAAPATDAAPEPPAASPPPASAAVSDEAWIETARCSSCNECRNINDRLFGYNDNQQAYIRDLNAGTYRQLVEAAEACQVAIIHPGKPSNPNEPGLEELIERARVFA